MAAESTFDIVCRVDLQEVKNAIQYSMKEIINRFDFKGSGTVIQLTGDGESIEIASSEEFKLNSAREVLETKLVKRGVSLKVLNLGKIESALGGTVRQKVELQNGIPIEKAREIVKIVKRAKLKVQVAIQEKQLRVSGKKRDDLQSVMGLLKESDLGIEMQFVNYR